MGREKGGYSYLTMAKAQSRLSKLIMNNANAFGYMATLWEKKVEELLTVSCLLCNAYKIIARCGPIPWKGLLFSRLRKGVINEEGTYLTANITDQGCKGKFGFS